MKLKYIMSVLSIAAFSAAGAQSLLTVPSDARSLSMAGSAYSSVATGSEAAANPAGFVLSGKKLSAEAGYVFFQPHRNANHLASVSAGYGIGDRWAVVFRAGYFSHAAYDAIGMDGMYLGRVNPYEFHISAGTGFRIMDGLSAGVNVRYFNSAMGSSVIPGYTDGNAVSADIMLHCVPVSGLNISAGVSDIGSDLSYGKGEYPAARMPFAAKVGVSYDADLAEHHRLTVSCQGDWYPYSGGFAAGAGLEYSIYDFAFLRGGYRYASGRQMMPSYASVGVGGRFAGVSLSCAYLIADRKSPMLNTFSVSLNYEF